MDIKRYRINEDKLFDLLWQVPEDHIKAIHASIEIQDIVDLITKHQDEIIEEV